MEDSIKKHNEAIDKLRIEKEEKKLARLEKERQRKHHKKN